MTKLLLRAPGTFFTPFAGSRDRTLPIQFGRDRTLPIQFGRLKMTVDPKPNGGRFSASFNCGQRKITVSSKFYDGYENGVLPDDLFEDYGEHNRSVNIWWDVGWCPPPLNFDVSKIGITVIDAMRHLNTCRPIYLRVYGNLGELLPIMAKDTVRIINESGFKLAGFEVKDDSGSNFRMETLMREDLFHQCYFSGSPPVPIHMVILDGKTIAASDLYQLVEWSRCCLICAEPVQESVDRVWCWKPLWPVQLSLLMSQCKSNGGGNSLDEVGLSDDDANVNTFENDKIVSIWWDFERCPLPLNFDAPKIVSNITKALRCLNLLGCPIYFHAYGNIQEIGEDIVRFVCEFGFQVVGFRLDGDRMPNISFEMDIKFDWKLRSDLSGLPITNIVISDGYGYQSTSLDSLRLGGNIIMPYEIFLDEGSQGGGHTNDLFKDDENIFLEHHMEFGYLVGRQSRNFKSVNIWWDTGRCPVPLNFDISKIGITIVEVLRLSNTSLPIYLRVYGNTRELLPKMAKDTKRIISESGFKLIGFEFKNNSKVSDFVLEGLQRNRKYFSPVLEENLMMEDLVHYDIHNRALPQAIHMIVLDGKIITATALDQYCRRINCHVICLEPEQETVDGVWCWKSLQLGAA